MRQLRRISTNRFEKKFERKRLGVTRHSEKQKKDSGTMPQSTTRVNGYSNGHSGIYEMEDQQSFLFTSESVGEGHPGMYEPSPNRLLFFCWWLNPSGCGVLCICCECRRIKINMVCQSVWMPNKSKFSWPKISCVSTKVRANAKLNCSQKNEFHETLFSAVRFVNDFLFGRQFMF